MEESQKVITLKNVNKRFDLGSRQKKHLPDFAAAFVKKKKGPDFFALKDINISISQNEKVAIIGKNGSGKSTLLRIMARIISPTSGKAVVMGNREYLTGFGNELNPELTMRENIYYKATLMGLGKSQIKKIYGGIVSFTGLEKFIDTKLAYFSTGMTARLAFSVGMSCIEWINPPTLLLDEVIGAGGDIEFGEKAKNRLKKFLSSKRTLVVVTHNIGAAREICGRAIWLEDGKVKMDGPADRVTKEYEESFKKIHPAKSDEKRSVKK